MKYKILAKVHSYEVWDVVSDGTAEQILNGEASYEILDVESVDECAPAEMVEVNDAEV